MSSSIPADPGKTKIQLLIDAADRMAENSKNNSIERYAESEEGQDKLVAANVILESHENRSQNPQDHQASHRHSTRQSTLKHSSTSQLKWSCDKGPTPSLRSNSSARRTLNFDVTSTKKSSVPSSSVRKRQYNVVRSKLKSNRRVSFRTEESSIHNGPSIAKERTSNWVSQQARLQIPKESSFDSGKTTSSARRSLMFDYVAPRNKSTKKTIDFTFESCYNRPPSDNHNKKRSGTSQMYESQPSTLNYDYATQGPLLMDHPYAQLYENRTLTEDTIGVKDAATSPIDSNLHRYERISGIMTLRSSGGSKAFSNRSPYRSGRLSGMQTLASSFSKEGNRSPQRSEILSGVHTLASSFSKEARLVDDQSTAVYHANTPVPISKRFDANSLMDSFQEFDSPTFSKIITSTPYEPNANKDTGNVEPIKLSNEDSESQSNITETSNVSVSESAVRDPKSDVPSDDDSVDGDVDFLNDLTIYEYFDKFEEMQESSNDSYDEENCESEEPVDGHCIDVLDKETLQLKKKKGDTRKINKKRKERGLSYTKRDGTIVPAREVKPPCSCRMKCDEKYSEKIRRKLLSNLLRLKLQSQNQFLANHITVKRTARPQVVNSRRSYSRIYKMPGVNGSLKVCKIMFQATYDIGCRKMRTLAAKILQGMGIPADDARQQNSNRQPVSQDHLRYIQQHILSFPAYSSHYTRERSSKLYLSSDLSIRRIYELYQNKCAADNLVPVHYNTYRMVFKTYNLSFRQPKTDTCGKCDRFMMQIKTEANATEKEGLQILLENHQKAAERVYNEKRTDINLSKTNATVRTCSFDLQKQLATPHLRNGEAFYSRQLYTYNLTVFSSYLGENSASCFLWDETKGKRGSQEIGSCLLQDLQRIPCTIETVVYYSDRCSGQNNNKTIIFLFSYFIELMRQRGRKLQIFHKFMHSGHSHMEVDTVHGAIEKAKKKSTADIEIPHDWAMFISTIRRKIPFVVVELEQKDILNLKSLETRYQIPKKSTSGEPFRMKDAMVFRYSTEHPELVEYKADVMDTEFKTIKVLQTTINDVENVNLEPISTQPIELPSAKLDDLRKLMPYIKQKEYYSTFLKTLVPPKKGRRGKNTIVDHFEADRDPLEDTDED